MSNIVYGDELYNEEIKHEYLSIHKAGSRKILERIFKITCNSEKDLNKDVYDFSREELRKLFYLFMSTTPNASKYNVNYISSYIDWAIEEGYLEGINPLDGVSTQWKEQFVVRPEKRFWTDTEIKKMISKLKNAQDAAILYLLYQGVRGTSCTEITHLQRKDIDEDKQTLRLTDEGGSTRILSVDAECIRLCLKAYEESTYIKKNGKTSVDIRSETSNLIENDYVIRLSNTRVVNTDGADENIVYRRFATIAQEFEQSSIKPTDIFQSGMLAVAKDSYIDKGILDKEAFSKITERFNISTAVLQRLKNDFLNIETIIDTYDLS